MAEKDKRNYELHNIEETEALILNSIIEYISIHQYAPSIREIQLACGITSSSTVHKFIKEMLRTGKLETDHKKASARCLRVPGYTFVKQKRKYTTHQKAQEEP